jgi:hypothetical protein
MRTGYLSFGGGLGVYGGGAAHPYWSTSLIQEVSSAAM